MSRKNSAQKTIHRMLDNDPRYLRPDSRGEINQRIGSLQSSSIRKPVERKASEPPITAVSHPVPSDIQVPDVLHNRKEQPRLSSRTWIYLLQVSLEAKGVQSVHIAARPRQPAFTGSTHCPSRTGTKTSKSPGFPKVQLIPVRR